ncbi:hypothetical protein QQ045_027717 [Rhodiola kirilowii]
MWNKIRAYYHCYQLRLRALVLDSYLTCQNDSILRPAAIHQGDELVNLDDACCEGIEIDYLLTFNDTVSFDDELVEVVEPGRDDSSNYNGISNSINNVGKDDKEMTMELVAGFMVRSVFIYVTSYPSDGFMGRSQESKVTRAGSFVKIFFDVWNPVGLPDNFLKLRIPKQAQQQQQQKRPPIPTPLGFREEDDDDDNVEMQISRHSVKSRSLKEVEELHQKALKTLPFSITTVFMMI